METIKYFEAINAVFNQWNNFEVVVRLLIKRFISQGLQTVVSLRSISDRIALVFLRSWHTRGTGRSSAVIAKCQSQVRDTARTGKMTG